MLVTLSCNLEQFGGDLLRKKLWRLYGIGVCGVYFGKATEVAKNQAKYLPRPIIHISATSLRRISLMACTAQAKSCFEELKMEGYQWILPFL